MLVRIRDGGVRMAGKTLERPKTASEFISEHGINSSVQDEIHQTSIFIENLKRQNRRGFVTTPKIYEPPTLLGPTLESDADLAPG